MPDWINDFYDEWNIQPKSSIETSVKWWEEHYYISGEQKKVIVLYLIVWENQYIAI